MPRKNPKGKLHKVRIRTFVNGKLRGSEILTRMVYETKAGWRMWDSKRRLKVPLEKISVNKNTIFQRDRYIEIDEGPTKNELLETLRKTA